MLFVAIGDQRALLADREIGMFRLHEHPLFL